MLVRSPGAEIGKTDLVAGALKFDPSKWIDKSTSLAHGHWQSSSIHVQLDLSPAAPVLMY